MAGTWAVSDLIEQLEVDPWRQQERPFAPDMQQCQQVLFDPRRTRQDKLDALTLWLAEFQPCLFGQMEAKQNRLAYCLLTENDLARSDDDIRQRIEQERQDWKRRAVSGDTHAFIILALSERIARAKPGATLLRLAQELCLLYLGSFEKDTIIHDDLMLEINDTECVEAGAADQIVKFFLRP